jgi:hypothetical protein
MLNEIFLEKYFMQHDELSYSSSAA